MKRLRTAVASSILLMSGCASQATTKAVQDAAARFYARVDAEHDQTICNASAPHFRTITPQI